MEIKSDIVKTEEVTLRDIDVQFGLGQGLSLTLESGGEIIIPKPLCSGDIQIQYASARPRQTVARLAAQWTSASS